MKIYEIYDEEAGRSVGVLLYYDKDKSYVIELQDDLDQWSAPLLFSGLVSRGIFTVPKDVSDLWVRERIIPSGRQNLYDILATHKLKEYRENDFLEIAEGRCSQDALCVKKLKQLPDYVEVRQQHNLIDVVMLDNYRLLCFFVDDTVKMVELEKLDGIADLDKILKHEAVYDSGTVGTGGYSAVFNGSIHVPATILHDKGADIPLSLSDFKQFIKRNLVDTTQGCDILECSRQNVAYMVKQQYLHPLKEEVKGNLFLRGEIEKNTW